MAFLTNCTNKGCGKYQAPYLDLNDNQAYCEECGKVITSITHFAKETLKNLKQVKRTVKAQESWAVKCQTCPHLGQPTMKQKKLYCAKCGIEHTHLSAPMATAIKMALGGSGAVKRSGS